MINLYANTNVGNNNPQIDAAASCLVCSNCEESWIRRFSLLPSRVVLALSLLMLWIRANYHNSTATSDYAAFVTHFFNGRSYLHINYSFLHKSKHTKPLLVLSVTITISLSAMKCKAESNYFERQVIRPFDRSYGDNSKVTLSPVKILI